MESIVLGFLLIHLLLEFLWLLSIDSEPGAIEQGRMLLGLTGRLLKTALMGNPDSQHGLGLQVTFGVQNGCRAERNHLDGARIGGVRLNGFGQFQ